MSSAPSDHATILSGLLLPGDNSLPMLLDYLHQCERSGALSIHTAYGTAQLYYQGGELRHATYQQHAGLQAIAVLMQVQDQAAFTFQLNRESAERSVNTSLGHLLMNAAQILDEGQAPALDTARVSAGGVGGGAGGAAFTSGATPVPAAPPRPVAAPDEPEITYDLVPALTRSLDQLSPGSDDDRRLLRGVNARRSVAELARHTRLSLDEVTRLLGVHLERGELTLGPPLLHGNFWIEVLRLTNTVAGKDGDEMIKGALAAIGAVPGAIPVARGRTFLKSVERQMGEIGTPRRQAFSQGCYQLRMMILNATNTTEEDWNLPDGR